MGGAEHRVGPLIGGLAPILLLIAAALPESQPSTGRVNARLVVL